MLDFLLLPTSRTYWHDHMQAPRPWTSSFLDSPASTSTPTCVSLRFYCNNWMIIKFLNQILLLDNPKYVWRQILLDLTKDSHIQRKELPKTWLGFTLLYLGQNIKPYMSYGLRDELENSAEKTFCLNFNRSSLILDWSSQTESYYNFCSNSIPT